ncbi:MAG: preprotein translocase subunit SecE [Candidatus Colwellbacteria bacterium]|nr:preprotein translocase subunit SecE [Candidatus Colwellbacteria bacterium]
MFRSFRLFFREAVAEFRKVNWPSREETAKMVATVIVVSAATLVIFGVIADRTFLYILARYVVR